MKKCKYCGKDIHPQPDLDGTYEESYCDKLHRKSHETQLIKEGKMEGIKPSGFNVLVDNNLRDSRGDMIHFKEPYFDRALQRTFHSKKEKAQYMKKNKLHMDGSSTPNKPPVEAGDAWGSKPTYFIPK